MQCGVGEGGGGGGGGTALPLFGHVCTLNEEKISSCSMSATAPSLCASIAIKIEICNI